MLRLPPRATLTATLCPHPTLFRSLDRGRLGGDHGPFALRRQQDRFDAFDEFCGIHYAIAPQSGSGVECVGGGCADDGRCARRITEAAVDCWLAHAKVDVALLSPGGSRSNNVITAENRAPWCRSESCLRTSLCFIPVPTATKPADALALHDQARLSDRKSVV